MFSGSSFPQSLTYNPSVQFPFQPLNIPQQFSSSMPNNLNSQIMLSLPAAPQYCTNVLQPRTPPVSNSSEKVVPLPVLREASTKSTQQWPNQDEVSPVSQVDIAGAVQCVISVNDLEAQCVIDSGSGVSLVSRNFVAKHRIPTTQCACPNVAVAEDNLLSINEACVVNIGLLGLRMTSVCEVIDLGFDALLGMDFHRQIFFVLDFREMILILRPECR